MVIHQRIHPGLDQETCFGCKIASVGFGAVPGASRPAAKTKAYVRQRTRGLEKYAERRKAGEQPDGTTLKDIEKYDKRVETFAKLESNLREDNPKDVVDRTKKSALNARK